MNANNEKMWKEILIALQFPEERHAALLKYIDTHMNYESNATHHLEEGLTTTLHMALKTLSKLNWDKLHIINAPAVQDKNGKNYFTGTLNVKLDFSNIDLTMLPDLEMFLTFQFVEESINKLTISQGDKHIYIYQLFSAVKRRENQNIFDVNHRFFTNENEIEFIAGYTIHYLKKVDKPEESSSLLVRELKLQIETEVIPAEQKDDFIKFLEEIGNKIPTEEQILEWHKRQGK